MTGMLKTIFFPLFTAVMVVQGIHVAEHIIQLAQVHVFDVPEDDALGLLGYVFDFQGTEEWLHLVFNAVFLLSLFALLPPLRSFTPGTVPYAGFAIFVAAGLGLESWHVVEHGVIISHVIQNDGCPCPGIVDAKTGLTDTVLHFFYNTIAYSGVVAAYWPLARARRRPSGRLVLVGKANA